MIDHDFSQSSHHFVVSPGNMRRTQRSMHKSHQPRDETNSVPLISNEKILDISIQTVKVHGYFESVSCSTMPVFKLNFTIKEIMV